MGISVLNKKPFWEILETHGEIDKKPLKNYAKNISEVEKTILTEYFFNYTLFLILIPTFCKKCFSKILFMFRDIDIKHNA